MMMTNFGAALALAAALALVSGEARAAEEITKQKCSITYRRSPTVHTECLVRFDMSQGFVSEEILMRTGKHWNRHGQMVSIKGGTTIEYDKKVPVSFGNPATVIHLSEWANFKPLKDLWKTS